MPHDMPVAAAPEPGPEPTWTRRDDKLLELYLCSPVYPRWDRVAVHFGGKTLAQACERYERMVAELRHVLDALEEVETPREWDMQIVATTAAPVAEQVQAVVPPAPPVAAEDDSTAPMPANAAVDTPEEGQELKKRKHGGTRKKPEMWTEEEHKLFLEGLKIYGKGKWKAMWEEHLPTKSASQIASHYQKYRNRSEQRKRNDCKRKSIHDITDDHEPARKDDELARPEGEAPGEDGRRPAQGGEVDEEFLGEDLETLFT
ncbi:transcription factor SRM1-like [Phragmites australis]|uniref:transcription factor SRM1-like n=1 Tax=Phragmites australis TaxID=29695 RepID=UPI002D7678ED|nr:transcription factor SRM1-like [Phragmites australis]